MSTSVSSTELLIEKGIELISGGPAIRWRSLRDGHIYAAVSDPMAPLDLGPAQSFGGPVWDDAFWFRVICTNDCDDPLERKLGIERIDKRTGSKQQLGASDARLGNVTLFGDYVYWGIHREQADPVRRVLKRGGQQESIRIWPDREDHVKSLTPYPGRGLLVVGRYTVAWISGNESTGVTLFRSKTFLGDAVADDQYVFVAERGLKYDDRPGYIYRISIVTGSVERLTGPLREPERIAAHGDSVYFMLRTTGDVWSVPKIGGAVTKVVPGQPYDSEKGEESLGLWAHECGLVWSHGNFAAHETQTLRFRPWR